MRNHIADDKIRTKEKYINNSLHLARKLQYIQKELFQYKSLRTFTPCVEVLFNGKKSIPKQKL